MSALDHVTSVTRLPLPAPLGPERIGVGRFAASFVRSRLNSLREVAYLRDYDNGVYRDLDVDLTLDYMRRRFVLPIARHVNISDATLLDCAAGFGWLAFAYLFSGGNRAILVEPDEQRLNAARAIAKRLGIERRCHFIAARLQDIDLGDDAVNIFTSVETLEHVGRADIQACVRKMARIAKDAVVLTAPNFLFPVVAHDTELPFAHWLPAGVRHRYAVAKGRARLDRGNQFPLPWDLAPLLSKFRPTSRYQTFSARQDFDRFYPHYVPYGSSDAKRYRPNPRRGQRLLQIALAGTLGRYSFALAPNLASLWCRC